MNNNIKLVPQKRISSVTNLNKLRYNLDKEASKYRPADKTVIVPRSIFTRLENRQYIVRRSPEWAKVRTVKFVQRQNHQTRYYEIVDELRPRFLPRTADEFEW